jgi:hypothetical protein
MARACFIVMRRAIEQCVSAKLVQRRPKWSVASNRKVRYCIVVQMRDRHTTGVGLNKIVALTLAALSIFVLTHVLSHSHRNGRTEAGCQLCQAAHARSLPTGEMQPDAVPLVAVGYVQPFIASFHETFLPQYSPSRAPPVA